jgi:hypothetical protein
MHRNASLYLLQTADRCNGWQEHSVAAIHRLRKRHERQRARAESKLSETARAAVAWRRQVQVQVAAGVADSIHGQRHPHRH